MFERKKKRKYNCTESDIYSTYMGYTEELFLKIDFLKPHN